MPRGKSWTKAESVALVEAFVHISEDEIIGVNQRKETLFERVIAEAKRRYGGDWGRGVLACKSRWQLVSREVSKFISADLIVQSVERSGWNEDDYFNATVKAYHGCKNKTSSPEEEELDACNEMSTKALHFEFKEEWEILKHHEKWRATLSKSEIKRKASSPTSSGSLDSPSTSDEVVDDEASTIRRPIGTKKAKTVLAIKNSADSLIEEMKQQQVRNDENRDKIVSDMLAHMKQSTSDSIKSLKDIVSESTEKITRAMRIKLLLDSDWSNMSPAFRENAQKSIEEYFNDTVLLTNRGDNN